MVFSVYLYEGDTSSKQFSRSLALDRVADYCVEKGIDFDRKKAEIKEREKGKPYIDSLPVFFNVSHSGLLWICMVGDAECGIDIQTARDVDMRRYEKIMQRYYSRNEQRFCEKYGMDGFFRIWSHREAVGKYTGEGFYSKMPDFVDDTGMLNIDVILPGGGEKVFVKDEPIGEGIFLSYCTAGEDDEIRFVI